MLRGTMSWMVIAAVAAMAGCQSTGVAPGRVAGDEDRPLMLADAIDAQTWASLEPVHRKILIGFVADARAGVAPPLVCFAPGSDPKLVEAFAAAQRVFAPMFVTSTKWGATSSTPARPSGEPVTLRYSFVPDGTSIPAAGYGDQTVGSDLRAFLNGIYGNQSVWLPVYQSVFDRWGQLGGLTLVYEPNDDGASFYGTAGQTGVRGDIRISGKLIDGPSNILAYNYYPSTGDQVLDTGDTYFNTTSSNSLRLRNVVSHEIGHGLGLAHSCPVLQTKLMEPYVTTAYDGPRHDDIRGIHTHYGDVGGYNNSAATATNLGSIAAGGSVTVGQPPAPAITDGATLSIDGASEADWYRFVLPGPGVVRVTLTPKGLSYDASSQSCSGSTASCCSGNIVDSLSAANLAGEIRNSIASGNQVLASFDQKAAGLAEDSGYVQVQSGGEFFLRVSASSFSSVQLYQATITYTQPCLANSTGLIGRWSFDAGNASDASGLAHTGTVLGGATFAPGISGQGLVLDGVDDSVQIPDAPALNPSGPFSIAAWYYAGAFTGTGNDPIVEKGVPNNGGPVYQYHLGVGGSSYPSLPLHAEFNAGVGGSFNAAASPANTLANGAWQFIVGTFDGTTLRVYVNGVLKGTDPASGVVWPYAAPLRFGRFEALPNHLPAKIDEVRLYNRALTNSEISYLLANPDGRPTVLPSGSVRPCRGSTLVLNLDSIEKNVSIQWRRGGLALANGATGHGSTVSGAQTATLTITNAQVGDVGSYDCVLTPATTCAGPVLISAATSVTMCLSDIDDGSGTGVCDGGTTIEDLLYYLSIFEAGSTGPGGADVDDGTGSGTPDGGVTIEDLLYFLVRFESGC